jgi:lipid II:glycine glycyltransferase (peptidoglycan interpeptide bridge formation enzyme)
MATKNKQIVPVSSLSTIELSEIITQLQQEMAIRSREEEIKKEEQKKFKEAMIAINSKKDEIGKLLDQIQDIALSVDADFQIDIGDVSLAWNKYDGWNSSTY